MQKILIVEDDTVQLEMLYETIHSRYPAWEIKKDPLWKLHRHPCRNLLQQMNISLYFYWTSS